MILCVAGAIVKSCEPDMCQARERTFVTPAFRRALWVRTHARLKAGATCPALSRIQRSRERATANQYCRSSV